MPYKDPDKKRQQSNRYYHAHKEQCSKYTKRWYYNNRDYALKSKVRWKINNPLRAKASALLNSANSRALRKGLECSISLDWVAAQLEKGCALSGLPFDFAAKGVMNPYSPSLDRIDPTKGYTEDNTQAILQGINGLKLNGTNHDVLVIAKAICQYIPE